MSITATTSFYPTIDSAEKQSANKPLHLCVRAIKKAKGFIFHPDVPSWVSSLCGQARAIHSITRPLFNVLSKLNPFVAATQFTSVVTMPLDFRQMILDVAQLIREKGKHARLDNTLGLIGDVSLVGDGAATFMSALIDLGGVASSFMRVAGPLALISALVSSVFFVIHGRGIYYNARLLHELKRPEEGNESSSRLMIVKKREYHLKRQCGVNIEMLLQTIETINTATENVETKELKLQKTYEVLRTRIKQKAFSHALGILITAVGVVAGILFFIALFTPFAPIGIAGSALLIVLFTASMSKMAFEVYCNWRFKKRMRSIALTLGNNI